LNAPIAPDNQSIVAETYLWNFGDETTSTEVNPVHQYSAPGVYEIQLIASDLGCGLSDTATQTITITDFNGVSFTATAAPDVVLPGSSSQLNVTPGGYPFIWTPEGTLNNSTIQSPVATPTETTTYNVSISDGVCETNTFVTVRVVEFVCGPPNIYVPNAFTPNKDDRNEKLFVRANFIDEIYFVIYDRWGEKIFESTSLNDGWDGFFNGKELDPDVYVYYLEATCAGGTKYFDKGNITLIR
jgi:gliding motility-associated-like protein